MRLDISYRVHFRYAEAVSESQNEIRMQPREGEHQRVLSYSLACDPPAEVLRASDYWGTAVDHLGVRAPHTSLRLVADASVETFSRPVPGNDCAVDALGDPDFRSQHFEFLEPSEHVAWEPGDAVSRHAAEACAGAASVPLLASLITYRVRQTLAYVSGSTAIGVSLEELLVGRKGVCQDFAHLAIGMLRSVGVPARYVSGYLFAADETVAPAGSAISRRVGGAGDSDTSAGGTGSNPSNVSTAGEASRCGPATGGGAVPGGGASGNSGADAAAGCEPAMVRVQTHAWIEAALPGWGWWALDPTNGGEVGERHVVIGCGRDYADVPPVRGAFTGSGSAEVDAEVVIGRGAAAAGAGVGGTSSGVRPVRARVPDRSTTTERARWQQQQQ